MKTAKLLILMTLISAIFACGKKPEDNKPDNSGSRGEQDEDRGIDTDILIKGQKLSCEDRANCPESIAKIVINARKDVINCTGTLIDNQHILTSGSCLPKNLRTVNIDCSKSIFFVFAETKKTKAEVVACDKVVYVDKNSFREYPEVWQNDKAILKLKLPVKRRAMKLNRKGIRETTYKLWKVDTVTDKIGILRSSKCKILRDSYANPLSSGNFSGMQVGMDCELGNGNTGAPLYNPKFGILAVMSKDMAEEHYSFLENSGLLKEEIGSFYHFSNVSCMNFSPLHSFGALTPKQCNRNLTFGMLDRERNLLIYSSNLHSNRMKKIVSDLNKNAKYFKWNHKFVAYNSGRSFEALITKPRCIYRVKDWYLEFCRRRRGNLKCPTTANIVVNHKKYVLNTKFNRFLKPVSELVDTDIKSYEASFRPLGAYRGKTNVALTSEFNGNISNLVFEDITSCQ